MKILFMTGSHPRHAMIARAVASTGALAGLVIEQREAHIPSTLQDGDWLILEKVHTAL